MNWNTLFVDERLSPDESIDQERGRSNFHRDFDRIIFSSSFRRLGKKTQVHPLASNDHVHSRLTHSLEVASVGRSLGYLVGDKIKGKLPDFITPENIGEIVQAACVAHDIGNPPFGHAGEDAIRTWFGNPEDKNLLTSLEDDKIDDLKNFEGNAQGFRVVTRLEYFKNEYGMRLTYNTLGAMLKYPWTSSAKNENCKFGAFQADKEYLEKIAIKLGLVKKDEYHWCRHPLAFLTEAADDICYRILDLEDAHEMKILQFGEIQEILEPLCKDSKDYRSIVLNQNLSDRRKMSYIRGKAIGNIVYNAVEAFIEHEHEILLGNFDDDILSKCNSVINGVMDRAKDIANNKIFNHARKIELEIGAYSTIGILLQTFCSAVKEKVDGRQISFRGKRVIDMMGINAPKKDDDLYNSYLSVLDYISGMTDNYATFMAKQIGGYGE